MRPKISAINLTTGGQVIAPSDHVTLIVGPNNVGKSAVLTTLLTELSTDSHVQRYVEPPVASVVCAMPPPEEMRSLIAARAKRFEPGVHPFGTINETVYFFPNGQQLTESYLSNALGRTDRLGQLAGGIVLFLGPEGRGAPLASQQVPDLVRETARTPLQRLWEDRELEATVTSYMQRAFGREILVNRHAGAQVHLHVGGTDIPEPAIGVPGPYLAEVMKLPLLHQQGAGMQAFMGTMLSLAADGFDIVLLDEPETFLHPPQARLLGQVVAEMSKEHDRQIIVATHSDDFVQGVINASAHADTSIVRLTRPTDDSNHVAQVDADAIKAIYRDPLLRFSNIIDGIFYKGVVLCESESDCTYYSVTLDSMEDADLLASDLLFTQCGGKDRLAKAYGALSAAAVPTAVIADIDMLADKSKFSELFERMGGSFATIEASYNVLDASVAAMRKMPTYSECSEAFGNLSGDPKDPVTKADRLALADVVRVESGWKQMKRKGFGAVDSGDPTAAFSSILAACKLLGLFLVEVGELERFHPQISGNKQAWLRQVLEQELFRSEPSAHPLMREVHGFISSQQ
ncbi:ATP-dependent nuclease [Phycicoccus jejuensis]|uniref:ATP-dependent nuclease n=1 Tax=Phycicoccus jejuensis TaxID=367299 RepID=UPI0014701F18|nr:AAA family ATPase [Phycicoccus jejuensis]